jgi:hypothetical protein
MKTSDKVLSVALGLVPIGGFYYLFSESFNPNKVLFSNDGPLGVMNSQWCREGYNPGSPLWQDLHWLGNPGGVAPVSITTSFYWLCSEPLLFILVLAISLVALFNLLTNTKPEVPFVMPDEPAQSRALSCSVFRYSSVVLLPRLLWILADTSTEKVNPLEALFWVGYLMVGLLYWFSVEEENYRYEKSIMR